ncbi:hypothetical protein SSX86_020929 [Deinandra increscens subsp. villosa]|uniref:Uncharacterized protein n=1 Tax=Deinandra increscens subsp. villosa TaxID=3103831 RepID=A0AAP0GV89_9ASTR
MLKILNRRWTLMNPDTKIHQIKVSSTFTNSTALFRITLGNYITYSNNPHPSLGENVRKWHDDRSVRYDLLHPLVNGNKARKLDALIPLVEDHLGTDVIYICQQG